MGAVFSMVLYEPVFAVMARELKDGYRRGIITITLLGGFASTVFIPMTHVLVEWWGWRSALQALAMMQIPFGIAVHWLVLRDRKLATTGEKLVGPNNRVRRAMMQPVFWLLALSYAAHTFMFTGITFHIIPLLTERGFPLSAVVGAYAVVGPFQVLGRIFVFALERRINVRLAGTIATLLPVVGMALLLLIVPGSPLLYVFAAFYGSGIGIKTIVQATAGPEFLGREGYGALQGTFAAITSLVQAATPFTLAVLWSVSGIYDQVLWVLFASACISAGAFLGAVFIRRETPSSRGPSINNL